MSSISRTLNASSPLSSALFPAFSVPTSFLPSVVSSPAFCMYFIVPFVFYLYSFLSYLPAPFLLYVFVYLRVTFLSVQLLFFSAPLFNCFSFLSFCFLFSLPLPIQFVCIRLCFYFSSACVSHFHSNFLRRMLNWCGNASICIRKVSSSNLRQNTIMTENKDVYLPGCRLYKPSSRLWHVVVWQIHTDVSENHAVAIIWAGLQLFHQQILLLCWYTVMRRITKLRSTTDRGPIRLQHYNIIL